MTAMAQTTSHISIEQVQSGVDRHCEVCVCLHIRPLLQFSEEEGNADESSLYDRPRVLAYFSECQGRR